MLWDTQWLVVCVRAEARLFAEEARERIADELGELIGNSSGRFKRVLRRNTYRMR